jgi:hypothetical protein
MSYALQGIYMYEDTKSIASPYAHVCWWGGWGGMSCPVRVSSSPCEIQNLVDRVQGGLTKLNPTTVWTVWVRIDSLPSPHTSPMTWPLPPLKKCPHPTHKKKDEEFRCVQKREKNREMKRAGWWGVFDKSTPPSLRSRLLWCDGGGFVRYNIKRETFSV